MGSEVNPQNLIQGRFTRPFNLNWQPKFLVNPCELAPVSSTSSIPLEKPRETPVVPPPVSPTLAESPSVLDYVRQQVAQRAELPPEAVQDRDRLLSDLHLNSITVGQLVIESAQYFQLSPPASPTDYANATVAEIAQAIEERQQTQGFVQEAEKQPLGVDRWIRTFTVEWEPSPLPAKSVSNTRPHEKWEIIALRDDPLKTALEASSQNYPDRGVVVCLPAASDEMSLDLLLQGAKTALESDYDYFILVQQGGWGAGFARTLHLEAVQLKTCVVHVPPGHPETIPWITAEIQALQSYCEVSYDVKGQRRSRYLKLQSSSSPSAVRLSSQDVLLVTGGGKGIAAECALSLAQETGVRLALMGRSHPEDDSELAKNLQRFANAGITVKYCAVDVTEAIAVTDAMQEIEAELGAITAFIHGAGVNHPKLIQTLDKPEALQTIAPKIYGLQHILSAIEPQNLRLLVSFGSIIAETGLPGEADYAIANEWLGCILEEYQTQHPDCHCLNLEWSVWSGAGMGERLGRIEALQQQGITPISPDIGIAIFNRLLACARETVSVVITGRFPPTLSLPLKTPDLPFLRFLEKPKVYYPQVELVVECELSPETDPYLNDHIVQNERVLPGVIGLEAMAQAVMALLETSQLPTFEQVQFNRPVVIPSNQPLIIRIATLVQESGKVEVVLRSEQTAFAVDHFRATALLETHQQPRLSRNELFAGKPKLANAESLYQDILFQQGRFQRLRQYQRLQATECLAQIALDEQTPWFSRYLPRELVLGDPGAKDAVIHALQACIPHATLIPVGVAKIRLYAQPNLDYYWVFAKEQSRQGNMFIYDLQIINSDGTVLEQWEGLQLQVIQPLTPPTACQSALFAPYIERRLQELLPLTDLQILIQQDATASREARREQALTTVFGHPVSLDHRPDGKPELKTNQSISVSHTQDLTLIALSSTLVSCDLETVTSASVATWQGLLGQEKYALAELLRHETKESLDMVGTRLWTALECLKKAGLAYDVPLILNTVFSDGWVILQGGENAIATWVTSVQGVEQPLSVAILFPTQETRRDYYVSPSKTMV